MSESSEFYDDQPEPILGPEADVLRFAGKPMELLPSEFVELNFMFSGVEPFSFMGREYLRPIYNSDDQLQLMMSGRQIEKTCAETTEVLLASGATIPIKDIIIGDRIVGLSADGAHLEVGRVTWKSRRYLKPCMEVRTRQGHVSVLGVKHPLRCRGTWVPVAQLSLGAYVAVIRRGDTFSEGSRTPDMYWSGVAKMHSVGRRWCYDISTTCDSFIADGFVTHNSTTRGNQCILYALSYPGIREMYVTPSDRQTKDFSFERLRTPLLDSPRLASHVRVAKDLSVYDPVLTVGSSTSVISLRSCFLHADRVRGRRADILFIDELQDILSENLPVIEQCIFHGRPDLKMIYYSGTPKTFDNPLEHMWSRSSTMTELMFPCRHHGTPKQPWTWYWFPITVECIGKHGLICPKCGKPVLWNDPDAVWVDTAPNAEDREKRPVKAYHIPQVITPMANDEQGKAWRILLRQRKDYPAYRFYNEIMGVSYDYGTRPISEADLARCCIPEWEMRTDQLEHMMHLSGGEPVYAGIDWGGEEYAYTVIVLGTYVLSPDPDKFFMFYVHRFSGREVQREKQLELLYNLIRGFHVRYTIADYGMGYYENDWLVRRLGAKRFAKMQYIGKQQMGKIAWRPRLGWYTAYKSAVVQDFISAIKKEKLAFPAWSVFGDPYAQDMLNLRGEWNERRQELMWGHGLQSPVDTFHAALYCLTASLRDRPRPDITHLVVDDSLVDPDELGEDVPFRRY